MNTNPIGNILVKLGLAGPGPVHPFNMNKLDYEWEISYEWYLSRIEGRVIVDGGCLAHLEFDKVLSHLGFKVFGVDIGDFSPVVPDWSVPNFMGIKKPAWQTELPCGIIDTAIANSLFEHLGLPCYGQDETDDGDKTTVKEFYRILKHGGVMLMQVPFGKEYRIIEHKGKPFYRVYDKNNIIDMLNGYFTIEEWEYYIRDSNKWVKASYPVASRVDYDTGLPKCVAYLKVRKNG